MWRRSTFVYYIVMDHLGVKVDNYLQTEVCSRSTFFRKLRFRGVIRQRDVKRCKDWDGRFEGGRAHRRRQVIEIPLAPADGSGPVLLARRHEVRASPGGTVRTNRSICRLRTLGDRLHATEGVEMVLPLQACARRVFEIGRAHV